MWVNDGSGTFTNSGQSLGVSLSLGVELGDVDVDGNLSNTGQPVKYGSTNATMQEISH